VFLCGSKQPHARLNPNALILGIESSCDETSAAVVAGGLDVRSAVVRSQIDLHRAFGGIVPELACRAHVETIVPVIDEALRLARRPDRQDPAGTASESSPGVSPAEIDAVAVTHTPGLVGALLVGLSAAKAFALAHDKPLIGVHHLEAHLYACRMGCPGLDYPCVSLVVSGGHTSLFQSESPLDHRRLGGTLDDAAGEAFDKAAAILGLPFPGGPSIENAARGGNAGAVDFPRTMLGRDSLDFSFSGVKTALLYEVMGQAAFRGKPRKPGDPRRNRKGRRADAAGGGDLSHPARPLDPRRVADLCASFQEAVVDVLAAKILRAAGRCGVGTIAVGGGVACNARLREKCETAGRKEGLRVHFPPLAFCTDNAAMVAGLGFHLACAGRFAGLDLDAVPTAKFAVPKTS
jgi:N6-L-threonylcarbamoyladenine synthase